MTTTLRQSNKTVLDSANPNTVSDSLRKMRLGTMMMPRKVTLAALVASATVDITTAASFAAATISPALDETDPRRLPPIGVVKTLRVTTVGTAAAGARLVTDSGGTASATVALISDDGKTLTFEGTVTGLVIEYIPRSFADLTDVFEPST